MREVTHAMPLVQPGTYAVHVTFRHHIGLELESYANAVLGRMGEQPNLASNQPLVEAACGATPNPFVQTWKKPTILGVGQDDYELQAMALLTIRQAPIAEEDLLRFFTRPVTAMIATAEITNKTIRLERVAAEGLPRSVLLSPFEGPSGWEAWRHTMMPHERGYRDRRKVSCVVVPPFALPLTNVERPTAAPEVTRVAATPRPAATRAPTGGTPINLPQPTDPPQQPTQPPKGGMIERFFAWIVGTGSSAQASAQQGVGLDATLVVAVLGATVGAGMLVWGVRARRASEAQGQPLPRANPDGGLFLERPRWGGAAEIANALIDGRLDEEGLARELDTLSLRDPRVAALRARYVGGDVSRATLALELQELD